MRSSPLHNEHYQTIFEAGQQAGDYRASLDDAYGSATSASDLAERAYDMARQLSTLTQDRFHMDHFDHQVYAAGYLDGYRHRSV